MSSVELFPWLTGGMAAGELLLFQAMMIHTGCAKELNAFCSCLPHSYLTVRP